jgi:hypothetical protein
MGAAQVAEIEVFSTALMFAKEFCEGHNRTSQDCLRDQHFNRRTYNIISAVNDLLDALAPRRDIYQVIGMMPYTLLCTTIDVLVECTQGILPLVDPLLYHFQKCDSILLFFINIILYVVSLLLLLFLLLLLLMWYGVGPCPENQVLCVQRKALEVCKQVITSPTLANVAEGAKFDSRIKAVVLLSSLLENRHDDFIEKSMAAKIERSKLDAFGEELAKELQKSNDIAKEKKKFIYVKSVSASVHEDESETDEDDEGRDNGDGDDDASERKSVCTVYTKFDPAEDVETHVRELKQALTNLYKVIMVMVMILLMIL